MSACRWDGDDLVLELWVQPGARTSGFAGRHGDALKLRVAAPPVEGRANRAVLDYLAALFAVPRSRVLLEQGAAGRGKRVRVLAPGTLPRGFPPA